MKQDTFSKDSQPKLKRAAIYCRVSTEDQSCERQERDLVAFAERAGYQVVGIYKEVASGARDDRKVRAKIITQAQGRHIDTVLVTELTRWGRSTLDLINTVEALASYRVSLVAQTGMTFDLATPQGKLMLTMLAGFSQFERDLIAERTKSGLASAVAKGVKLGRPCGNKTDEAHREAVLELHKLGFSIRPIANKLKISKDTVSRILKTAVTS
jgi:putative DNA-invertase from lambdoid prophage Rac